MLRVLTYLQLAALSLSHVMSVFLRGIAVLSLIQSCAALYSQEVLAASHWLSLPLKLPPFHNGSYEGNEVWLCEGNDKG